MDVRPEMIVKKITDLQSGECRQIGRSDEMESAGETVPPSWPSLAAKTTAVSVNIKPSEQVQGGNKRFDIRTKLSGLFAACVFSDD